MDHGCCHCAVAQAQASAIKASLGDGGAEAAAAVDAAVEAYQQRASDLRKAAAAGQVDVSVVLDKVAGKMGSLTDELAALAATGTLDAFVDDISSEEL